jgi:hypothetical protein
MESSSLEPYTEIFGQNPSGKPCYHSNVSSSILEVRLGDLDRGTNQNTNCHPTRPDSSLRLDMEEERGFCAWITPSSVMQCNPIYLIEATAPMGKVASL